jgi:hypothetical protein
MIFRILVDQLTYILFLDFFFVMCQRYATFSRSYQKHKLNYFVKSQIPLTSKLHILLDFGIVCSKIVFLLL